MPSPPAAVSPPPIQPSNSEIDDEEEDDVEYEYEYEEIEVEEEVEVEEEIEEEIEEEEEEEEEMEEVEGDDECEIGEDLTPVREKNHQNDNSQLMEPQEHEQEQRQHLKSDSLDVTESVANPLLDIPAEQENAGDIVPSKLSETGQEEKFCPDGERTSRDSFLKAPVDESPEANDIKSKALVKEEVMADASVQKDNGIESAVEDSKQVPIRLDVAPTRAQASSSSADFEVENNKRQKIVCEFHAKGWCIKGKSCRFLHVTEGLDVEVKKSDFLEVEASSNVPIPPPQNRENHPLHSLKQAGRESLGQNSSSDDFMHCPSHLVKCSLTDRNITPPGHFPHNNHHRTKFSSFGTLGPNNHSSLDLSYSHYKPLMSFGSSSRNVLDRENRPSVSSSFRQRTSPIHESDSGSLSGSNIFKDKHSNNFIFKISSDDWTPSTPFRPSHIITQNLLSKESLYDPIRDSVEQKKLNNSIAEEKKPLNPVRVKDTGKSNMSSSSVDKTLKFDVDIKKDGNVQAESNDLKIFQSALIEFVKELVKPTWKEGLMSKDAHKIIVKKSVDKVISTEQAHEIPNSAESIKLYLSSSQTKLEKLVEGYIEKYGKC